MQEITAVDAIDAKPPGKGWWSSASCY